MLFLVTSWGLRVECEGAQSACRVMGEREGVWLTKEGDLCGYKACRCNPTWQSGDHGHRLILGPAIYYKALVIWPGLVGLDLIPAAHARTRNLSVIRCR